MDLAALGQVKSKLIMQQFYFFRAKPILLLAIAIFPMAVACRPETPTQIKSSVTPSSVPSPVSPISGTPKPDANQVAAFELALDKAAGGHSISQSALSSNDWQLVANQYDDAIALLRLVKSDSPYYSVSQTKIQEYQRLSLAARKRSQNPRANKLEPVAAPSPKPSVAPPPSPSVAPEPIKPPPLPRIVSSFPSSNQVTTSPTPRTSPQNLATNPVPSPTNGKFYTQQTQVFSVPIKRRAGGTPVIEVTFNGKQKFEMIVDTGASGTVITQAMADALRIVPTTTSRANTASAKNVEFPIGYVRSMEASGVKVGRTAVAIAGAELDTGLLGHDFFKGYDITIKRNVVEFSPHSEDTSNPEERPPSVPVFPKPHRSPISP